MNYWTIIRTMILVGALITAGSMADAAPRKRVKHAEATREPAVIEEATVTDEMMNAKLVISDATARLPGEQPATDSLGGQQVGAATASGTGTASSQIPGATDVAGQGIGTNATTGIPADAALASAVPAPPKIDVNKAPESEIPVLANAKETKKAATSPIFRIMMTLGVLAAAFAGLSFFLKRYINKQGKAKQNKQIKVLTQHALGPKKNLAIIQVAGETLLIGVTDHNISMLKTLSLIDDELPESVPTNFNRAMEGFVDEDDASDARVPEEFTLQGISQIRDTVSSRIKSMRNS